MAKLITKTLQYYDWSEVTKEVEANCGRKVRDWAGKWGHGLENQQNPYLDFWHKILEYYNISEYRVEYIDFDEFAHSFKNESWIREICDEYIKVLGKGEHPFKFDW